MSAAILASRVENALRFRLCAMSRDGPVAIATSTQTRGGIAVDGGAPSSGEISAAEISAAVGSPA